MNPVTVGLYAGIAVGVFAAVGCGLLAAVIVAEIAADAWYDRQARRRIAWLDAQEDQACAPTELDREWCAMFGISL